jgi:hypothetical protein
MGAGRNSLVAADALVNDSTAPRGGEGPEAPGGRGLKVAELAAAWKSSEARAARAEAQERAEAHRRV